MKDLDAMRAVRPAVPACVGILGAVILCISVGGVRRAALGAEDGGYEVDKTRVYYGDIHSFSKPAAVRYLAVFKHISYYKQILEENLTSNDPRYWILIRKTNKVFRLAVQKVAEKKGYDLVAEKGAVSCRKKDATVPDITDAVIKAVKQ